MAHWYILVSSSASVVARVLKVCDHFTALFFSYLVPAFDEILVTPS